MAFSFSASTLAQFPEITHTLRDRQEADDEQRGRRGDGRRIGDGARGGPASRRPRRTGSRCSTWTATPPGGRPRAAAGGDGARGRQAVDVPTAPPSTPRWTKVRGEFGPIEIMVTSAGIDEFCPFTEITIDAWERMLAVNLTGTFHCLQAAVPDMLAAGWGRIVTISSSSAQSGAARHGALRRVQGRRDRAHQGAGGRVRPARHHREHDPARVHRHAHGPPGRGARRPPERRRVAARTPVRRAGTPDDIAAACAFLCSEEAGYITGQSIGVNGGWYCDRHRASPRAAAAASAWDDDVRAALHVGFSERSPTDSCRAAPTRSAMPNAIGTMLRHPALAGRFLAYNGVLLFDPALEPRLRELIVLAGRVADASADYEWVQHVRLATALGITPEEIDADRRRRRRATAGRRSRPSCSPRPTS